MTGIERLRALAYKKNFLEPAEARELDAIADQIEREQNEMVADSPYDAVLPEDREAIAWVREHGGLEAVRRRWECLGYYADPVPRSCMEKRLARLQRQIDESHAALRRRRGIISELNHRASDLTRENAELRKRAMPDGMEWPRYEDGEMVRIGGTAQFGSDDVMEVVGVELNHFGYVLHGSINDGMRECVDGDEYGVTVKRPAPKVLDADGVEIRVGDEVWDVDGSGPFIVSGFVGEPLAVIFEIAECNDLPRKPSQLTHERPVADTWERLEKDACKGVCDYFHAYKCDECEHVEGGCCKNMARDIVRRAKALAGVSE